MTELDLSGAPAGRSTETMGYPLPPRPPRAVAVYDGWGRYKLPSPSTGRPTGFTRATTVASTLDDTYNLSRWKRRETAKNLLDCHRAALAEPPGGSELGDLLEAIRFAHSAENKGDLDAALDVLDDLCGARDAAELGTAVHAWLEAVDLAMVRPADVPEMFAPYVAAYQDVLCRYGLVAEPAYVERVVLNDRGEESIAGTLDRIYRVVATGELVLGDVKTSKTLEYGWLTYATQLAIYGYANHMLAADGSGWEPMPVINADYGIIVHVPSDQPERADAVTMDLWYGGEAAALAIEARSRRRQAKKAVPHKHAIPLPTDESLRYVAARRALTNISDPGQLTGVWESYRDIWTDELTQLGQQVAALFDTNTNTE